MINLKKTGYILVALLMTGCMTQAEFRKKLDCVTHTADQFGDNLIAGMPMFSYGSMLRRCERKKEKLGSSKPFLRSGQKISYFMGITPVVVQAGGTVRVLTCFEVRSSSTVTVNESLYLLREGGEKLLLTSDEVAREGGVWLVETDIGIPSNVDAGAYHILMDIRYGENVLHAQEVFEISKSSSVIRDQCNPGAG